jgi:hypothetical protein
LELLGNESVRQRKLERIKLTEKVEYRKYIREIPGSFLFSILEEPTQIVSFAVMRKKIWW